MKRNASISLLDGRNATSKVPKTSITFDSISELVNNRQSDQLKTCLENSNINLRNDDSLLMNACKVGDENCARILLAHGADVSFVSQYSGYTALTLACLYGHDSIVELLVEHGAKINPCVGFLPLVEACEGGNISTVRLLLNSGARVDEKPRLICDDPTCYAYDVDRDPHFHDEKNALMVAATSGNTALVALLLQSGAAVETKCENMMNDYFHSEGYTALTFASENYHWDTVKLLLSNGADINETRNKHQLLVVYHPSPLTYACEEGDIDVVKELLEMGADINAATWEGDVEDSYYSPLISASAHGHVDIVEFILAHKGFTAVETVSHALVEACEHNHDCIVNILGKRVGDLNAFYNRDSGSAETPLSKASEHGGVESVKMLLAMGANVNAPVDGSGGTALMRACRGGNVAVAKLLLERGALVEAADSQGETVLMSACRHVTRPDSIKSLVTLLIEHDADINRRDNNGNTVLMRYAVHNELTVSTVLNLLLDYGADVTVKNQKGETVVGRLQKTTLFPAELRQELIALCRQYEVSNRRNGPSTAPVLK